MQKCLIFILIYLQVFPIVFADTTAQATAKKYQDIFSSKNYATNGGFEDHSIGWTASGSSTLTIASAAGTVASGKYSGQWNATASGETLTNTSVTINSNNNEELVSTQCMFYLKYNAGDANLIAEMYDGTNNIQSYTLSTNTIFDGPVVQFFPCPASGTLAFRLRATADAASITLDSVYWGLADPKMASVQQASIYGSARWPGTAACSWTQNSVQEVMTVFAADTDCTSPTGANLTGAASAPATKVPGFTFTLIPAGRYKVEATGSGTTAFGASGDSVGDSCYFDFYDGTNAFGGGAVEVTATNDVSVPNLIGYVEYTTDQSNITIQVRASGNATAGASDICRIQNVASISTSGLRLILTRFPTAAQTSMSFDAYSWRVDANIIDDGGGNLDLTTSDVATYATVPSDANLVLTNNSTGTLTCQILCASGTASTGTTCSVNEAIGISCTPPGGWTGVYEACVKFGHLGQTPTATLIDAAFQLVTTGNADVTVAQNGTQKVPSKPAVTTVATATTADVKTIDVCSRFTHSSAGAFNVRLFYEQDITGTPTTNTIVTDALTSVGQRSVHWKVEPVISYAVPLLVNIPNTKLTSSNLVWAQVTSDGSTCTVTYESGPWLTSGVRNGEGDCSWTVDSGIFSGTSVALGAPICICSHYGSDISRDCFIDSTTVTTNLLIRTQKSVEDAGGLATTVGADGALNIICAGTK